MPAPTTTYMDCEGMVTYRPFGIAIYNAYHLVYSPLAIRGLPPASPPRDRCPRPRTCPTDTRNGAPRGTRRRSHRSCQVHGRSLRAHPLPLREEVDRVLEVLLEHPLDLLQRLLLAHAGDVVGARERHLRHRGCFHRERAEVLRLERMDIRLPARACEHLHLEREGMQEVVDALRSVLDHEALAQLRILCRDPDRAAARMAVIA